MPTRRRFLGSLFAATATLPALKSDALTRILPATRHVAGRSADDIAQDEDFWREIQAAFDIDRGMINLNNGGVAPSPRVVNAAWISRQKSSSCAISSGLLPSTCRAAGRIRASASLFNAGRVAVAANSEPRKRRRVGIRSLRSLG